LCTSMHAQRTQTNGRKLYMHTRAQRKKCGRRKYKNTSGDTDRKTREDARARKTKHSTQSLLYVCVDREIGLSTA